MQALSNGLLTVVIGTTGPTDAPGYYVQAIELTTPAGRHRLLEGEPGREFAIASGGIAASACSVRRRADGGWEATLSGEADGWTAREVLTLAPNRPILKRAQTYRFNREMETAICPGFRLKAIPAVRYTCPLLVWEQPLIGLSPQRAAVDWALPLPFHVWHDGAVVAIYGLDKRASPGTIDFAPVNADGWARISVYYPDTAAQPTVMSAPGFGTPLSPGPRRFKPGSEITMTEIVGAHALAPGEDPLLEAERLAADELLAAPPPPVDFAAVADGIARFYPRCELWEPDAFGPGRGWFANMWVRTHVGPARKRGDMSGYFDLGWGEGIAVETILGIVHHWKRTGETNLLAYVDEMTRNIELFKRGAGDDQPYFDRSDGRRFGDFMMDAAPGSRIWTHSLGHTGSQLLQAYQAAPDYPTPETRDAWLAAAASMARFFAKHQKANGDLQDIFDDQDREVNAKAHRVTARAVVCGLWTRYGLITGDRSWTARALRLAYAVAPEIERCEYYNQMIDGLSAPIEFTDGESAYYVLEGLVPLYAATRDPAILALCKRAASFGIAWTYFYDLPNAYRGIARGGQCCRMPDYPLLYPIGPAKAMTPLLDLHDLTGDPLFERMAAEAVAFIGRWQVEAPGRPWDGGMIHAWAQFCGKPWGPDLAGQVDTGMATGNSLAAIEAWMARKLSKVE